MQPKKPKYSGKNANENNDKHNTLACKFPGLAIPNDTITEKVDPISDVMAELEALAPSVFTKYGCLYNQK